MGKMLNYGCREKNTREYRKALRECRKNKKRYGVAFDDSETWNLDMVVLQWCYDNHVHTHPIIKRCRFSEWLIEDYISEYYEEGLSEFKNDYQEYSRVFNTIRENMYEDIFYEIRTKFRCQFCDFILPRLKRFKEISLTYPSDLGEEAWNQYVQDAIDEIETEKTFEKFLTRISDFSW